MNCEYRKNELFDVLTSQYSTENIFRQPPQSSVNLINAFEHGLLIVQSRKFEYSLLLLSQGINIIRPGKTMKMFLNVSGK